MAAVVSILITSSFISSPPPGEAYTEVLWTWMQVDAFHPQIGLYLDALSVLMTLVVTFVAFLIHLYSAEFMIDDEGYSRFFCYMNLFVASMITLLLGNNLLLLCFYFISSARWIFRRSCSAPPNSGRRDPFTLQPPLFFC